MLTKSLYLMNVDSYTKSDGIDVKVWGRDHFLRYPERVWRAYSPQNRRALMDNIAFAATMEMPNLLGVDRMEYNTAYPMFASVFFENVIQDLLYTADTGTCSPVEALKKFINTEFVFDSYDVRLPDRHRDTEEEAVISFTFGKESLLTYAILRELEMPTHLVFTRNPLEKRKISEDYYSYQGEHVERLARMLKNKFKQDLVFLENELMLLTSDEYLKLPDTTISLCTLMTNFALSLLPFNNYYKAKYLFFGNEQSCNDAYINKEGFKCYPVFDQSARWTLQIDSMARLLTKDKVRVGSLMEPLHELAIVKILHGRYKDLGRLQMSCFSDNEYGKESHWCQSCSKCVRIFLFLQANGIDPKTLGFKDNLFKKDKKNLYSLLRETSDDKNMIMYDKTGTGRDEQLFSFYLAHKRGVKGDLMDEFKKKHLEEAAAREDELYRKFFNLYEPMNIPKGLKKPIISIYREELSEVL